VTGFYLSPPGMVTGIALANLLLGLGTLWVVAILLARLQRSTNEAKRMSAAVEQSPVSIFITDTAGRICYVNPKFTDATGYTLKEVAGKNPRILKSGETPPEDYERLWGHITAGKEWRGTFHNRKKNGELYWASASSPRFLMWPAKRPTLSMSARTLRNASGWRTSCGPANYATVRSLPTCSMDTLTAK